jgi:ferritin-like metal-binding protein YciE
MHHGQEKVIEYLRLAYSQEKALITTLQRHVAMSKDGDYKSDLMHHLTETTGHARRVRQRLNELGYRDEEHLVERGLGFVQSLTLQGLALAKAPMDLIRGKGDVEETMLRNARDEAMTEAAEIANYLALERIAEDVGDGDTAELARDIRADEEAMLRRLGEAIPNLAGAIVRHDPAPTLTSVRKAG